MMPRSRPEPLDWPPAGWQDLTWRTGREVGRTVILQMGAEPNRDEDPTIGTMDSSPLGRLVVAAVNHFRECCPQEYARLARQPLNGAVAAP